MPSAAADATEVMLLRTMAILEEYRRMTIEEVGKMEKLRRDHAAELKGQEQKWEASAKRYSEEAAKHRKMNIQHTQELGKLNGKLEAATAEREKREKEALAREAELTEKAAGAEFEVTVAREAQKEVEREVAILGEKLRKALADGEARVAALSADYEKELGKLRAVHEKELSGQAEDFEERLAEAYAEHDSEVAHLQGRLAQAGHLYEAGFGLGFDRARQQIELLVLSFDVRQLDQEKVVQDGALILDPDWGFGELEGEGGAVEVEAEEPVVEGKEPEAVAAGGGGGEDVVTSMESAVVAEGDVPAAAEGGQLSADKSCAAEVGEQAVVEGDSPAVGGDHPAVEGDLPVAVVEPDVIDLS